MCGILIYAAYDDKRNDFDWERKKKQHQDNEGWNTNLKRTLLSMSSLSSSTVFCVFAFLLYRVTTILFFSANWCVSRNSWLMLLIFLSLIISSWKCVYFFRVFVVYIFSCKPSRARSPFFPAFLLRSKKKSIFFVALFGTRFTFRMLYISSIAGIASDSHRVPWCLFYLYLCDSCVFSFFFLRFWIYFYFVSIPNIFFARFFRFFMREFMYSLLSFLFRVCSTIIICCFMSQFLYTLNHSQKVLN